LDIKPSNILIDNNGIRLCDFGSAHKWSPNNDKCSRTTGTSNYQAPEVTSNSEYSAPLVDSWGLGVLLHIILVNEFPYGEDKKVLRISKDISREASMLIRSLLQLEPEKRLLVDEIMNHEYFNIITAENEFSEEIEHDKCEEQHTHKAQSNRKPNFFVQRTLSLVKMFSTKKTKKLPVATETRARSSQQTNSL